MTDLDLANSLSDLMPLEARPVYRRDFPTSWRESGHLVIWAGDTRAELDKMDEINVRWLRGLDGLRTWREVIDQLNIAPETAGRIIRALKALGAIDDATDMPTSWRWLSAVERDDQLGDLAAAAHTYPNAREAITAFESRQDTNIHVIGTTALANELYSALNLAGLRTIESDVKIPNYDNYQSLIIFADGLHPDIIDEVDTPLHDHPHLPATVYGARAIVGPLVIPGVTSCLRCAYLHTVDADAMWPKITLQLASQIRRLVAPPKDRLLIRATAVQTALLVRMWLDQPQDSEQWAEIAFELRLPGGRPMPVRRPPHPLCGCSWAQLDPMRAPLTFG